MLRRSRSGLGKLNRELSRFKANVVLMQVKEKIAQIVENLPEEVLGSLLEYLKQLEKASIEKKHLSLNLSTILSEDKILLEKLAK